MRHLALILQALQTGKPTVLYDQEHGVRMHWISGQVLFEKTVPIRDARHVRIDLFCKRMKRSEPRIRERVDADPVIPNEVTVVQHPGTTVGAERVRSRPVPLVDVVLRNEV